MINIEYTLDSIEGEEGPNLYFKGKPGDYLKLANDLHILGEKNDIEIDLKNISYVNTEGNFELLLTSKKNAIILLKKESEKCFIELSKGYWQVFLCYFYGISFEKCHDFLDFEERDFKKKFYQDAKIIISSEW